MTSYKASKGNIVTNWFIKCKNDLKIQCPIKCNYTIPDLLYKSHGWLEVKKLTMEVLINNKSYIDVILVNNEVINFFIGE